MATETRNQLTSLIPVLRARARRLCRNEAESDDLVQETMLRALRFEGRFAAGTNLRAWLYTVLRNVFISRRRRRALTERSFEELQVSEGRFAGLAPLAPDVAFLSTGIERALRELPIQFAKVVCLVDLQDHAYKDAAQLLEVPVGTVMSRLSRGRRLLAESLAAS